MAKAYKCDNCGKLMDTSTGLIIKKVITSEGKHVEVILKISLPNDNLTSDVCGDYCFNCAKNILQTAL